MKSLIGILVALSGLQELILASHFPLPLSIVGGILGGGAILIGCWIVDGGDAANLW